MDFVVNSDPIIRFAFWSGLGATVITVLLIVQITLLRVLYRRNEQRKQEFLSIWRGLFTESTLSHVEPWRLPKVAKRDVVYFLSYWNRLQDSVRGDSRVKLNELARIACIDRAARQMLLDGSRAEKLLAIVSLGHFGDTTDTAVLEKMLVSDQPIVCLHAARALLRIDSASLRELLPAIIQRNDLPTTVIANLLKEAGPDVTSPVIADMLRNAILQSATSQFMIRLIVLTASVHPSVVHASLREIMDTTEDIEVLAACLKVMRAPEDLPKMRELINHSNWRIRVHAATALGDLGDEKDLISLLSLLSDSQWWVRYRAAQAISHLPFVTTGHLEGLKSHLNDSFAIDILNQVISERTQ